MEIKVVKMGKNKAAPRGGELLYDSLDFCRRREKRESGCTSTDKRGAGAWISVRISFWLVESNDLLT